MRWGKSDVGRNYVEGDVTASGQRENVGTYVSPFAFAMTRDGVSRRPGATAYDKTVEVSSAGTLLSLITCEHLSMASQANLPPLLSNV